MGLLHGECGGNGKRDDKIYLFGARKPLPFRGGEGRGGERKIVIKNSDQIKKIMYI